MSASASASARPRPPPNRQRDKAQLSCNLCRRRKIKCDRQQPCRNCAHRSLQCTYANSGPAPPAGVDQHASSSSSSSSRARPTNLQARLAQLENLVVSLMEDGTPAIDAPSGGGGVVLKSVEDSKVESRSSEGGSIRVNASESRYVGSSHWASILDGIAELREHLETEDELQASSATPSSLPAPDNDMEMPLLYLCKPSSRAEIMDMIPPKQIVDRHISYYFHTLDLAPAAIHTGKFLREYEAFWKSPSEVCIMWLGLLYSIMCMAVISSDVPGTSDQAATAATAAEEEEDTQFLIDRYREKTAQCLILGKYANGGPYTWETLYQYVVIELSSHKDVKQTIGILHGISMNLLMQMGYHRDPSHFPSISPFDAELRRRRWVKSMEGDLQMAMQAGIPRRIADGHWDTREPRNLRDDDFDEDSPALPPGRPETEVTPALQLIARRRMIVAVGAAIDLATAVTPPAYARVMAVDRQIKDAEAALPPPLRAQAHSALVFDPPPLRMHRLYLALMFRTGELIIHRRYLVPPSSARESGDGDGDGDGFAYSRRTCVDSCLSILAIQQTLNAETAAGGLLHSLGAKVSLLGNHEFLTASVTLCGLVHRGLRAPGNEHALGREDDIREALVGALAAWRLREASSREAHIAAESVRVVLLRAGWLEEEEEDEHEEVGKGLRGVEGGGGSAYQAAFPEFGEFGAGHDYLAEFQPSMLGADLDVDGFPWFMDTSGGAPAGEGGFRGGGL